jgi:signal peptidase I
MGLYGMWFQELKARLFSTLVEYRKMLVFFILLGLFRGAIADWNPVPTSSMNPTIVEGDVIWVNKIAYDLKVPFTQIKLSRLNEPARGDIIVFKSQKADKRLVKRLIGLPGDTVVLYHNRLILNGISAVYRKSSENDQNIDLTELYYGLSHLVRLQKTTGNSFKNFGPVVIPENYYLMLGDNRDNSADSRVYGLVPRAELVGKASHVLLSLNPEHYYVPRLGRFVKPLL